MKVLDPQNAPARIKAFAIWGIFLWAVDMLATLAVGNIFVIAGINIIASGIAGFFTAKALKGKTGDNNSSALYGALPPVFAMAINLIIILVTGQPLHGLSLPLVAMVAGAIGGFISQRSNKK